MDLSKINLLVEKEFLEKRMKAEAVAAESALRANSSQAFKKFDNLERELVLKIAKLEENGKNTTELKNLLKEIEERKLLVLKKLGLSQSSLMPNYECKVCDDTGFVNGKMCNCFKKRRNEEILKATGLENGNLLSLENFETNFSNQLQSEKMQKLKTKLTDWANKFPDVKKINIIFEGKTGVGKTFATKCLAGELLKKNKEVLFISAYEMSSMFLKHHTTFNASKESYFAPLVSAEILIIDDLGTEPPYKDVVFDHLYLLLSERDRFNRPTIITTNLLPDMIMERYGERIYSRIFNKNKTFSIHLDGNDLRIEK